MARVDFYGNQLMRADFEKRYGSANLDPIGYDLFKLDNREKYNYIATCMRMGDTREEAEMYARKLGY